MPVRPCARVPMCPCARGFLVRPWIPRVPVDRPCARVPQRAVRSVISHFVRKGCRRGCKIAISPQFLAIEPRFVRKGCISSRLVGTAPRLKREIEKKEKEEGKRMQESKRAGEQEGKRECEDVMM